MQHVAQPCNMLHVALATSAEQKIRLTCLKQHYTQMLYFNVKAHALRHAEEMSQLTSRS